MRKIILMAMMAAALPLFGSGSAEARDYPWCAQYGMFGGGGRNCGFVSFAQCQATVSGIGGFCERNGLYSRASEPRRKRHRGHR